MTPSKKWRRMAAMYQRFGYYPAADYSDAAAAAMFAAETHGTPLPPGLPLNGFALGKKWMDVTLAMWREDIPCRMLSVQELLDDGYPEWFLKRTGILELKAPEDSDDEQNLRGG